MKDAIIVRKVTGPSSHERKDWRRRDEETTGIIFDYSLPILGLVFLGGKIMHLTKRPEQKITTTSSKKVVQKSEEEIKRTSSISQRTRAGNRRFVKAKILKIESVQIDWDETQWGVAGNGTPQGGDEMILILADLIKILNLVGELIWLWKMERLI